MNNASNAIGLVDTAISSVSSTRANLGAVQNRFESVINSLQVATENLSASESRIKDTDMALEMTNFTKDQILLQAGTAMLGPGEPGSAVGSQAPPVINWQPTRIPRAPGWESTPGPGGTAALPPGAAVAPGIPAPTIAPRSDRPESAT